ncbi:toll/interleukin-1 receptor domain-containing protein [Bacillus cereus]|uniref:toll/interleukin-1 receptor domain-containing protein n=1 Tax=Bacillus cereus group TaxID=86661 RepID=UPI000BFD108B|nr:toll/interleukin-1 receptor domain-containing protein [Bacillus cereus]MDA1925239.1 toll/interleukin-1 receptor domain-containing protein [Bacillus cereus]MDA2070306.1 toll/interleukin-1 receptor domain-containing protein [Bacillus cereus]PGK15570.1 hypothetical protein CN903_29085 [Bacillus cereus]QDD85067.1 hypothetical protein FORC087_3776 [Bacillus cereus]
MHKPKIFISHITEEKELARILKEEISKAFLGLPEIFVSSDAASISVGAKWLDRIDSSLKDAQIILLLCSQNSVKRPWINFEAGAGWVKGIPIVPICHTDINPVELPIPLNMLQGIKANNRNDLEKIIDLVARQLGAQFKPNLEYERIIKEISDFETNYGIIQVAKYHVNQIIKIEPQAASLFQVTQQYSNGSGFLSDIVIDKLKPHLEALKNLDIIDFSIGGNTRFTASGVELEFKMIVHQKYYDIAEKVMES